MQIYRTIPEKIVNMKMKCMYCQREKFNEISTKQQQCISHNFGEISLCFQEKLAAVEEVLRAALTSEQESVFKTSTSKVEISTSKVETSTSKVETSTSKVETFHSKVRKHHSTLPPFLLF